MYIKLLKWNFIGAGEKAKKTELQKPKYFQAIFPIWLPKRTLGVQNGIKAPLPPSSSKNWIWAHLEARVKRKKNWALFLFFCSCLIFNFSSSSSSQLTRKRSIDSSQMISDEEEERKQNLEYVFLHLAGREKSNCWPSFEIMWETLRIPQKILEEPQKFRRFLSIFCVFLSCIFLPNHALTDRTCANNNLPPFPPFLLCISPLSGLEEEEEALAPRSSSFLLPPPPFAPPVPHRTPNQQGGGKEEEEKEKDPARPYLRFRSNWRRK